MRLKHRAMAVALGVLGGSWILYGDITGPLPGMTPVGWLMVPAGVAAIVVAGALYLGWAWARWPGIVLSAVLLVLPQLAYGWRSLWTSGLDAAVVGNLLWVLVGAWIILVLLTDWPPDDDIEASVRSESDHEALS